jgi:hypothetical protein
MKFIIAPVVLIASLGLSSADPVDRAPPSQASSVTTEYPALHPFHHTVGETSFVGYYFNGKPSNCSVLIWSKSDNEMPAEKTTHPKSADRTQRETGNDIFCRRPWLESEFGMRR